MNRILIANLLMCVAFGCNSSDDHGTNPAKAPQPSSSVAAEAKVSVMEVDGDMAKVRTTEGKEVYVPKVRLQQRSTLDRSDESFTHVLTATTDAYDERPAAPPKPKVRATKDIVRERLNLNQLYLTEKTRKEVIAPARLMTPWDEESGERCFPALTCENPNCPGQPSGDRPYLFIVPFTPGGSGPEMTCPACAQIHDPATRTEAERAQYRKWIKPYRLPEQAARLKQLDAEIRESAAQARSRR
ncbi:MAG: hypothetical protein MI757_15160 [Pirellulales bacterium]|nr:hypothetical protein [Pirellulales bacterium]